MAVGMINQGGVGGGTVQCTATVRRKVVAHKNSVRQLCAANLPVRRTLCARIVRDNCALHTCGAHCVPVQCAATVRCKLTCTAHIVCQNSARQLCAANLRRTLCARTVRDNCALHTCGAHCVSEQCARKVICIRKTRLRQTRCTYKPQMCCKFAAYMRLIYTRDLIFW